MIGIAFWNVHKNQELDEYICNLITEKNIDIMIMAEYNKESDELCNLLSLEDKDFHELPYIGCKRIKIIADKQLNTELITENKYFSLNNIEICGVQFMIAALHFPSKMYSKSADHVALAHQVVELIEQAEKSEGHNNTIIIGDFNANPFEQMCVNANCFHALPDLKEAKRLKRRVESVTYKMFYNPMWNFFGDWTKPGGTYYRKSSQTTEYFWNIFDQVMFRPQMIDAVDMQSIEIVTQIGEKSLVNKKGAPDNKGYSDHLPIYIRIKEENLDG